MAGGLNLYQFNGNNPVLYTDPFGLCPPAESCRQLRMRVERTNGGTSPGLFDPVAIASGGLAGAIRGVGARAAATGGAESGTATFFRGVSQAEAADVAETGVLRAGAAAAGNTGKYLTNTVEAAAQWGAQNGAGSQVLKITVPADATKAFTSLGRIDGIGEAWWAPIESLKGAAIEVVKQVTKEAVP